MKLYATTTSERPSRPAKKGGDEYLRTEYTLSKNGRERLVVDIQTQPKGMLLIDVSIVRDGGANTTIYRDTYRQ